MLTSYMAEKIAKETIEKMGIISTESGKITNRELKEFIFRITINKEKNVWLAGEIFTNSDGFIINFYNNKVFREIGKNYSETIKKVHEKIKEINNSPEVKKNGKNILHFLVHMREFPACIEIKSIITINYEINEQKFQKKFQEKLQEIIDIIKQKWPYDLLE